MNLRELDISHPYQAAVLASDRLTPTNSNAEVRHLVLDIPAGDFAFQEGQSVAVLVPGPHEFGARQHLRLYSIASPRQGEKDGATKFSLCVRRCFYIDPISGERYPGRASNYLCDRRPGDRIAVTGPYGAPFTIPADDSANLLLIGAGTGIAPFRALVRRIYETHGGWRGKVRLFYGANTGLELLYMNDLNRDLDLYYDQSTFRAFEAVSPRPHFDVLPALERVLSDNQREVFEMLIQPNTYVYIAGLSFAARKFEEAMQRSEPAKWPELRQTLMQEGRYVELVYD
jgi:ferredoxin--NADP+ reductase